MCVCVSVCVCVCIVMCVYDNRRVTEDPTSEISDPKA